MQIVSRIAGLPATRAFKCQALHAAVPGFVRSVTWQALRLEEPIPPNLGGLICALKDQPKDA